MTNGADSAYARGDVMQFIPGSSHNHCFEESWCFRDTPFTFFYGAIPDGYIDVSVSFNSCNMMDIYVDIFRFIHLFASCQPKYNLNLAIASSTVCPYFIRTSF